MDCKHATKCNSCNEVNIDQSASHNSEDTMYCEGTYSSWLHRHLHAGFYISITLLTSLLVMNLFFAFIVPCKLHGSQ